MVLPSNVSSCKPEGTEPYSIARLPLPSAAEEGEEVMTEVMEMGAVFLMAAHVTAGGPGEKRHASGTFEVKVAPVPGDNGVASARMSMTKTFAGDLTGTS